MYTMVVLVEVTDPNGSKDVRKPINIILPSSLSLGKVLLDGQIYKATASQYSFCADLSHSHCTFRECGWLLQEHIYT